MNLERLAFVGSSPDAPPEIMADSAKGIIMGRGYVLRQQTADSPPDGRNQKLDRDSFAGAVTRAKREKRSRMLWDHGIVADGGFFSGPVMSSDLTLGIVQWSLTDDALEFEAQVAPLPGSPGDANGLMAARLAKIEAGVVNEFSIGFFRDWESTETRRQAQADEKPGEGEKKRGDLIVAKGFADKPGSWVWFKVAQLLEVSAVTWGVDSLTAGSATVQSLRAGTVPEFDGAVAYQPKGQDVARFALVIGRNGDTLLLRDIQTQEPVMRQIADVIPVTMAEAEKPAVISETKIEQAPATQSAPVADNKTKNADGFDWSAIVIPN